jgi:hypothetical protein
VAVALAAIDRSLGIDLDVAMGSKRSSASNSASRLLAPADGTALDSPTASPSKLKSRAGPQSMFDAFKKWTMEHHTFSYVVLTDAEMATLSDGTQHAYSC